MRSQRMAGGLGFATLALGVLVLVWPAHRASAAAAACTPTRPDDLGPFYEANAPERARTGRGLVISGTVRSASGCEPLPGARIEWWAANPRGEYDDAHRATQHADADGRYQYQTDFPGRYPGRPLHLHVRVATPGYRVLVTQLYPSAGQTTLIMDFVLVHE